MTNKLKLACHRYCVPRQKSEEHQSCKGSTIRLKKAPGLYIMLRYPYDSSSLFPKEHLIQ